MRFPLQIPVVFWWTDERGQRQRGEGRSRDISEQGAFVYAPDSPPFGASVRLKIAEGLPEIAGALRIEFEGHVVRVEQPGVEEENSGFAVQSSRIEAI